MVNIDNTEIVQMTSGKRCKDKHQFRQGSWLCLYGSVDGVCASVGSSAAG